MFNFSVGTQRIFLRGGSGLLFHSSASSIFDFVALRRNSHQKLCHDDLVRCLGDTLAPSAFSTSSGTCFLHSSSAKEITLSCIIGRHTSSFTNLAGSGRAERRLQVTIRMVFGHQISGSGQLPYLPAFNQQFQHLHLFFCFLFVIAFVMLNQCLYPTLRNIRRIQFTALALCLLMQHECRQ